MSEFYFYSTPLHTAVLTDNHEEVYRLLKNNADIYVKDDDDISCYELALEKKNDIILKMFENYIKGKTITS
tara:strand:+ start:178 stop:390 length:213 start_codon:yes stop_codon:yes gene_type:complete